MSKPVNKHLRKDGSLRSTFESVKSYVIFHNWKKINVVKKDKNCILQTEVLHVMDIFKPGNNWI